MEEVYIGLNSDQKMKVLGIIGKDVKSLNS